jgi:hypothetical protein
VLGAGGLCCSTLVRAEEAEEAQEAEG